MISRIQYITQNHPTLTHSDLCKEACESGINWIQLRMKNVSDEEYLKEAIKCREITNQFGAKLIINDNIEIAKEVNANGVHLGQADTKIALARKFIGKNFIIGGTANTYEQIVGLVNNGVNYVGLGPFKFTTTKQNLNPIIGLKGYQEIIIKLAANKINIPLIAIGGIELKDVGPIMQTGVYGIAVSSLITNSLNKKTLVKQMIDASLTQHDK